MSYISLVKYLAQRKHIYVKVLPTYRNLWGLLLLCLLIYIYIYIYKYIYIYNWFIFFIIYQKLNINWSNFYNIMHHLNKISNNHRVFSCKFTPVICQHQMRHTIHNYSLFPPKISILFHTKIAAFRCRFKKNHNMPMLSDV